MLKCLAAILAWLQFVLPGCSTGITQRAAPTVYQRETGKPYPDVLAELQVAITEHNFRITGHNRIGSVIRERERIDFPDYDTLQFCNLTHAREMLEISPAAVIYMPCTVAVRSERQRVIVSTHLLPTDSPDTRLNAFSAKMNEQLKQIVDFAVED